jgi:hypothetical protein
VNGSCRFGAISIEAEVDETNVVICRCLAKKSGRATDRAAGVPVSLENRSQGLGGAR